jgi:hypothetical protein
VEEIGTILERIYRIRADKIGSEKRNLEIVSEKWNWMMSRAAGHFGSRPEDEPSSCLDIDECLCSALLLPEAEIGHICFHKQFRFQKTRKHMAAMSARS